MQATPPFQPAVAGPAGIERKTHRLVVDAPMRMFHWLFALSFLGAYLTADAESWRAMHVTLGYTLAGLLVFRLLYGLFGPREAGLGSMWRRLRGAKNWLRSLARTLTQRHTAAGVPWRQGQNLSMALAVVTLLALVVPLTLSGYATYHDWGDVLGGDWIEELHEFFGEAFLAVVLGHLALIAGLGLLRRKNLALPMLTGEVEGPGPDLVRHQRTWLAAALLAAVLSFMAWEWQQSPKGLIPALTWSSGSVERERGHDRD